MNTLGHLGGALGCLGLAALILARSRTWRIGGLLAWAAGCASLALWLAPSGHHRLFAAAAVVGVLAAGGLAWIFVRVPWLLAVAVLACAPARIPVTVGATQANLLLPMYLIVAAALLVLAWELFGDDLRSRELGALAYPLALFIGWAGMTFLWSGDRREGAIYLLFFVLPFGLLAVCLARLRFSLRFVGALGAQLGVMALAFAALGGWQYVTRTIYWNPKVKVDNAYTPVSWFYRVNSIFYDPSIYGRFLVVAIAVGLVAVLFGPRRAAWPALLGVSAIWAGLVPSFSQSSFVALSAAIVVGLTVLWRRRAIVPLAVAAIALVLVTLGVPQARHRLLGAGGLSHATSGRSGLVSNGLRLALHHPVGGVGVGDFQHAYGQQEHLRGFRPKKAASHDTPVTVAAEMGLPGLGLLAWLLVAGFGLPFRRNAGVTATERVRLAFGLALVAIVVHSLFYNALFEDPLFWSLLALCAVAVREETL